MLLTLALLAAAQAAPATTAPEEKKICRRVESTGSRMGQKAICRTKAQWAAMVDQNELNKRARDTVNTGGYNAGIDSGRFGAN